MTSLYVWLNKRHHAKTVKRITEAEISTADPVKFCTWEEMEARWDAIVVKHAAQPWFMKAARHTNVYLFGWNGLIKVRMKPRYIVNHIVWYHQRATRGWADCDTWNLDGYIVRIITQMLPHLAAHSQSYPGHPPFDTPEKWDAYLTDLAARMSAWSDEDGLASTGYETTKAALAEFAEHLGMFWD